MLSSSSTSLKIFASVAILTLVGSYGLSKFHNDNNSNNNNNNNKSRTQEFYDDCELSDDDTEKVIITTPIKKKSMDSDSSVYTKVQYENNNNNNKIIINNNHKFIHNHNNYYNTNNNNTNNNNNTPSIPRKHFIIIENLIINITKKQNQALYFRKRYHKNSNGILKQIDELREMICITEAEHLKNIHDLLDEIKNQNQNQNQNDHHSLLKENEYENLSHVKELEKRVQQEEAYLDTELKMLQADLRMLMWKYEELETYASKEWKNSQLEIQQLRTKLMNDATRFSKTKSKEIKY